LLCRHRRADPDDNDARGKRIRSFAQTAQQISRVAYLHLLQLCVRNIGSKHTRNVAPQTAGCVRALVHAPGGVVPKILIRRAGLPAHTLELPRLVTSCTDALLPVSGVRGGERGQLWCGDLLLLDFLWLLFGRGWRLELLDTVDGIPACS